MPIEPIFAHQYGWDELLLFIVPIVIAVLIVRRLDKRSRTNDDESGDE